MARQYWLVSPEVAGELGDGTVMDTAVHPPWVSRLHHRFQGWLGDDLLECFPCFLTTARIEHAPSRPGVGNTNSRLQGGRGRRP